MKIVRPEDVTFQGDLTNEEVAEIMGDNLKEEVFVYVKETDRTNFIATVLGRMTDDYVDRADVFTLVFEQGFSEDFAKKVKAEIAELWVGVIQKKHIDRPEDFVDPDNTIRKRWLRIQLDATENTLKALRDFIVH